MFITKTLEEQQKILHSPFNIKTHKETFINYLEVVIDKDGVVHYAVPSHVGALEKYLLDMKGIKYEPWNFSKIACELCPEEYYSDYHTWLCKETECIMVWGKPASFYEGEANIKQLMTLADLKGEGLY